MKLNVRCCCSPTKIFGTLEIPPWLPDRPTKFPVRIFEPPILAHLFEPDISDENTSIPIEMIEIKFIHRLGRSELAVYSDDRPIEFWRQLPGFREGEKLEDSI